MRTLHRMGVGLLALAVAGGLSACGDDGDDSSSTTTAPADATGALTDVSEDFCAGVLELNGAVTSLELDETATAEDVMAAGEVLMPPMDALVSDAPDDLADQAEELQGFVLPMADGDAEAFNSGEAFEAYSAFVADAASACEFQQVPVTAVDYAFEDVPGTISAGTAAFALTNAGAEDHEMLVMRKVDGVEESFEDILALGEEEAESMVELAAAGFAPPGGEATVLADLTPGEYLMICFVPVGGVEGGPPHFTEGMQQELTVE